MGEPVPGKKQLKVTAGNKVAATGGVKYKIAYRVKGTSTWKYKTATGKTLTIKSLKKGNKYQVKIQVIKTVNCVTYKGAWSAVKTSNKVK